MNENLSDDELLLFLKKLVNKLEKKELDINQINQIKTFQKQYLLNNVIIDYDMDNLRKYLILGWYIYTNIDIEK